MGKNILVASPQVEFNELLRLSLEESGAYDVFFAMTGEETLKTAEDENIDLIILDANITEHAIKTLVTALKGINKQLKFVILPPQNNPNHPSLEGLKPDGFLSRPFFKPALLEMLDEILSKDDSPIIAREEQTATRISEVKYESLDDTMSFSTLQGNPDSSDEDQESSPEEQQPELKNPEEEDILDLEAELENLISGEASKNKSLPDKNNLENDADTEELLNDVLAQIKSQNASEEKQTFDQELNKSLPEHPGLETEQVAEEIIQKNGQNADGEDSDDLLSNVLAQIKAQSVTEEPSDLESDLKEALSKSPEVKKVSVKPEDKPDLQSEKNGTDDLLKDVLSQIKSQSVTNEQRIEAEELEKTFSELEKEKTTNSAPEKESAGEAHKEVHSGDLLNDVLNQLKSQAVTEEKSELELELERTLSRPPERVVVTEIPRGVEPLDYSKNPEKESEKVQEEPEDILNKVKAQLQAQTVENGKVLEIPDDELKAILDEDQEILEIVTDEPADEDISSMLKRSSLEETRPILTSMEDDQETEDIEDSEIDSILHNVLAQLKIQAVEDSDNKEYSEEEQLLVEALESDIEPAAEEKPEVIMEEEPEIEAEADTEDIFQNVLAQLDKQKSDQPVQIESIGDFDLSPEPESSGLEDIHTYLVKLLEKEGTSAVVLAQNSKIISYEGDLNFNDIRVLQDILSQNLNSGSRLELARFVKLGEIQEKYLFYATSILGNLSLGIIQISTIPLSKLRSHTLKIANEFSENEFFKSLHNDLNKEFEEEETEETELAEEEIKQKTINELLLEPESGEIEDIAEEKEDWVPEIAETHFEKEMTSDTQPVKLGGKQNKKVFLKKGYGLISNKLLYPEKDSTFDRLKNEEKHQSIQIKNPKVPSIQMNASDPGSGMVDSKWVLPVFEISKAEKESESGKLSQKFPLSETQAKPETKKFSGSISERYSGTSKAKISDTARYKAFRDSEDATLDEVLSSSKSEIPEPFLTEKENIDDYLNDILSGLEHQNGGEEISNSDARDLKDDGNGSTLKDFLNVNQSAVEIDSEKLDPDFEALLGEELSSSSDPAVTKDENISFSDDELLEKALQNISSRLDSEQESTYTIDEETDEQLIQPSDEIMPPKKLTEDDLYVVANADGLLEDFLEKDNLDKTTDKNSEEDYAFQDQDETDDSSVRINGDSLNLMDDIYKLFEESATGDTNPIHISALESSNEDDFEEYFNNGEDQEKDITQTEKVQSSFSDELKFLESLDTQGSSRKTKSVSENSTFTEKESPSATKQEKSIQPEAEKASKFDTQKVILEVLSQMDKTEDEARNPENKTNFPSRTASGTGNNKKKLSSNEFEDQLEALADFGESYKSENLQGSTARNISDREIKDEFENLDEDDHSDEKEGDTPTAPVELEREKASDDFLIDLLPDSGSTPSGMMNGFPIYTCILVPRLSDYSLTTKYSKVLKEAMNQLSQAFGWELDNLIVQPTYMRWTVKVPPEISQGFIVRKVRQFTSDRLFSKFPELSKVNPSENFWAKGYLVVSGTEPPAPEFLDDFIQKNRRPKGILNK